jgi:SMC interacting uncharacterized protein involved in chromosome segregation
MVAELSRGNDALTLQVSALQAKYDDVKEERDVYESEATGMKAELDKLRDELDALKDASVTTLENGASQVASMTADMENLRAELLAKSSEYDQLIADFESKSKQDEEKHRSAMDQLRKEMSKTVNEVRHSQNCTVMVFYRLICFFCCSTRQRWLWFSRNGAATKWKKPSSPRRSP